MNSVAQFDLLVHPDYHAMNVKPAQSRLHPLQLGLRKKWEGRARAIKENPCAALIYISALEKDELANGLQDVSTLTNPIQREDIARIRHFRELLGSRFNLIANHIPITHELLINRTNGESILYDPEKVKLFVYGEYYGGQHTCVETWGKAAVGALAIPQAIYLADHCFGIDSIKEVDLWRKYKGSAGPEKF